MDQEMEALSAEQAADLAALEAMAREGQPGPGQEQAGPEVAAADPVESLAGLFTVAGYMAGSLGYRRVGELWGPETCRGLSEKMVPVLRKYSWGQRALEFLETGAGVEEIALGMVAVPLVLATLQAARADEAERAARHRRAESVPDAGQDQGKTIEGQPVTDEGPAAGMEWAA
jgi:hypothetical protein